MAQSKLADIYLYLPSNTEKLKDKQQLVSFIVKEMKKDETIQYSGYGTEEDLKKGLLRYIGDNSVSFYTEPSQEKKQAIQETVCTAVSRCSEKLPFPAKMFLFVFPWLPTEKDTVFEGSFGFAPYSSVVHLFITPEIVTSEAIADSVVHEINHAISYCHHFERYGNWTLLDHIINEGLAENFREDVLNSTTPAPWAIALSKDEAFSTFKSLKPLLNSKDQSVHNNVLFGSKEYKKWTGYSVGYWLVKEFKNKNSSLSWEQIVKTPPENILEAVIKNRA